MQNEAIAPVHIERLTLDEDLRKAMGSVAEQHELCQSIKNHGLINPLTVKAADEPGYCLVIAGARRSGHRAAHREPAVSETAVVRLTLPVGVVFDCAADYIEAAFAGHRPTELAAAWCASGCVVAVLQDRYGRPGWMDALMAFTDALKPSWRNRYAALGHGPGAHYRDTMRELRDLGRLANRAGVTFTALALAPRAND